MQAQTNVRCPNCGQPFSTALHTIIDVQQNPAAKTQLLSGRLNVAQCPHCGHASALATPLLYHDAEKELLIAFVPMELNLQQREQEQIVGDLMNALTRSLPKEAFRGYMFNPRRALTMQGLVEQILEADGVTPEMMEKQRATVRLIQSLLTTPEEQLPQAIRENDAQIDAEFFQVFGLMTQSMLQDGRPDIAEHMMAVEQEIAEHSTFGRTLIEQQASQQAVIAEVAGDLENLSEEADQNDLLDLAMRYAGDDQRLQAMVGLVRPVFDYNFFQELTSRISKAPAAQREGLEKLRDQLVNLTRMIDQQAQVAVQQAARLLQALLAAPDPDELIDANLPMIDDTFMAVLSANIQEAEKRREADVAAQLKGIYDKIIARLQAQMQPELRFINELLSTETNDDARELINERAKEYGAELLEVMDGVERALEGRADEEMLEKLAFIRSAAAEALG